MSPNPVPTVTPVAKGIFNSGEKLSSDILSSLWNGASNFVTSNLSLLGTALLLTIIIIGLGLGIPKIKEMITNGKSKGRPTFGVIGIFLFSFSLVSCGIIEALDFDTSKIHFFKFNTSNESKLLNEYASRYKVPTEELRKVIKEKNIKITDNTIENEARILSVNKDNKKQ